MGQFVYFAAGVNTVTEQILADLQLGELLGEKYTQRQLAANGPGGHGGVLLQRTGIPKYASRQRWVKSRSGKYYVGFDPNDRPAAEDLAREMQLAGHRVQLADGGSYLIPVARMITGGSALPQSMILGTSGEVVYEPLERYAGFWQRAEKLWQDILADTDADVLLDDAARLQLALEALGWNYYVSPDEVNLLGLINTQNIQRILEAIIDGPNIRLVAEAAAKANKKKVNPPDTDNLKCGGQD